MADSSTYDPQIDLPPDGSYVEIVTTEKFSDVSVDSSNTVTITGGEGGHDFDLSIDGTFSGGSARQTITESIEIKVNDAVTYDFEADGVAPRQCTTANSLEFR